MMAGGNGGSSGDHCGADGYVQNEFMISINSVNGVGETPEFDEKCAGLTACIFLGGYSNGWSSDGDQELAAAYDRIRSVNSKYGTWVSYVYLFYSSTSTENT